MQSDKKGRQRRRPFPPDSGSAQGWGRGRLPLPLPFRLHFIQLGILEQGAFKTAEGNHEARPAVQEAAFHEVHVQKGPEGMAECPAYGAVFAVHVELSGAKEGVAINLARAPNLRRKDGAIGKRNTGNSASIVQEF